MGQGKRIGYIRVSTFEQNPERQLEGKELDKKFIEYASGSSTDRPQLTLLRDYVREDDYIYIHSMDRLARNVKDLRALIDEFIKKGVTVCFVKENIIFDNSNSPIGNLMLMMLGSFAEFELSMIRERQLYGIAQAKKAGKYKGRSKSITPEKMEQINQMMLTRKPKREIAKEVGISRYTLHKFLTKKGVYGKG